jgi:hypothetical protein
MEKQPSGGWRCKIIARSCGQSNSRLSFPWSEPLVRCNGVRFLGRVGRDVRRGKLWQAFVP